jgi:hypothetical protein
MLGPFPRKGAADAVKSSLPRLSCGVARTRGGVGSLRALPQLPSHVHDPGPGRSDGRDHQHLDRNGRGAGAGPPVGGTEAGHGNTGGPGRVAQRAANRSGERSRRGAFGSHRGPGDRGRRSSQRPLGGSRGKPLGGSIRRPRRGGRWTGRPPPWGRGWVRGPIRRGRVDANDRGTGAGGRPDAAAQRRGQRGAAAGCAPPGGSPAGRNG